MKDDHWESYHEEKNKRRWTVKMLRKALLDFPPDAVVFTEGCDCDGDVGGVEVEHQTSSGRVKAVLLKRLED